MTYTLPDIADPAAIAPGSPVLAATPYARFVFGPGALSALPDVAAGFASERPAVICTPGRSADAQGLAARLPGDPLVLARAVMHTPVAVSEETAARAQRDGADLLVSFGGGSAIGLGKALAKRLGLPHVAVPTTYAGSEVTPILGETADGEKRTSRDDALRPAAVIYDPDLLAPLPAPTAAASAMNALAHSVEALIMSQEPAIVTAASRSIALFAEALPVLVAGRDTEAVRDARARCLYAAWLAAYCLAEVPMALHHKLCHALGGAYDMPHAPTHAAVLPHSTGYNLPACPEAAAVLASILGENPAGRLFDLLGTLGLSARLSDLGLPEAGIDVVARQACANPYANPRPFDEAAISALLRRAWNGTRPQMESGHA